jgi:hypothetical protein
MFHVPVTINNRLNIIKQLVFEMDRGCVLCVVNVKCYV